MRMRRKKKYFYDELSGKKWKAKKKDEGKWM